MPRSALVMASQFLGRGEIPRAPHSLVLTRRLWIAVENGLDVLAIEHDLTLTLEHFVAGARQAALLVLRLLGEVGANRINRVADEDRLDEAQAVIAVRERLQPVGGDESDPGAEYKRSRDQAPTKEAFFLGEDFVGHVGVDVHDQRVEGHAFAFGNRSPDRPDPVAYFEILPVEVLAAPQGYRLVIGGQFGVVHGRSPRCLV